MVSSASIYGEGRREVFERFGERITGNDAGLVLAVFTEPLDDPSRNALQKSFAALDYGIDPCTFADISRLEPNDVFALVEGIDPLCLVACDEQAALSCARATREPFPLMQQTRLFGRDARAVPAINSLMETESGRQSLWHQLKSLPHGTPGA